MNIYSTQNKDSDEYFKKLCRAGCEPGDFERAENSLRASEGFKDPYIPIDEAIRVFYALIYLEGKAGGHRVRSFQTLYNNKLSDAIFDYCIGAIAGELRHATRSMANHKIKFIPPLVGAHLNRDSAISASLQMEPLSLLKTAIRVFGTDGWSAAYGGGSWLEIAQVTLKISHLSRLRWIDEIVHCRHCGGKLFDRTIIFEPEDRSEYYSGRRNQYLTFRLFLDYRRDGWFDKDMDDRAYSFDKMLNDYSPTIEKILNYKPVQFGFTKLDYTDKKWPKEFVLSSKKKPNKTQKEIGSKPFHTVHASPSYPAPKILGVYVSSKYNPSQVAEFYGFIQGCLAPPIHSVGHRVYILYSYLSCQKQYIRKIVFNAKSGKEFRVKFPIKVGIALKNTNNPNTIKVYIDKV